MRDACEMSKLLQHSGCDHSAIRTNNENSELFDSACWYHIMVYHNNVLAHWQSDEQRNMIADANLLPLHRSGFLLVLSCFAGNGCDACGHNRWRFRMWRTLALTMAIPPEICCRNLGSWKMWKMWKALGKGFKHVQAMNETMRFTSHNLQTNHIVDERIPRPNQHASTCLQTLK